MRWTGDLAALVHKMKNALQRFLGSQIMPAPFYCWKDAEGIYQEIGDASAFQVVVTGALMYGQSLFAREEMLQGLINAATTIEEVQAISWDTVSDNSV